MKLRTKMLLAVATITVLTALVSCLLVRQQVSRLVEDEIGMQMAVQAVIASHLVKIAENHGHPLNANEDAAAALTTAEINRILHEISESVRIKGESQGRELNYEFWISDPRGKAYLRSRTYEELPQEFSFAEAKTQQPKEFLVLLRDEDGLVIQDSQPRDVDPHIYKYVGVGGADKPRIVQVGYHAAPLLERIKSDSLRVSVVVAVVQALCSGMLLVFAFGQVTAPIDRLTQALQELESDHTFQRSEIEDMERRGDEIAGLARVFSSFADRFVKETEELKRARKEADQKKQIFLEIDHTGAIVGCNEVAIATFGFSREELIGHHMNLIIPTEARMEVQQTFDEINEDASDNFNENCTKSGDRLWIHWRNRLIRRTPDETRPMFHSIGTDVTSLLSAIGDNSKMAGEAVRFAKEVMAQQSKQAEAVENMQLFLSNTAHELRDPLHSVRMYADKLAVTNLTPTQRHFLRVLKGQASVLRLTIGGLLDSARLRKGSFELACNTFSIRAATEDVVSAMALVAEDREPPLTLSFRIDRSVPELVLGDLSRFEEVLTNLVQNAVKFTPKGFVRIELSTTPCQEANRAFLIGRVIDSGIGISRTHWETIFQLNKQLPNALIDSDDGLGFGLYICRGVLNRMGGTISVEDSELGGGTTFRFEVPFEVVSGPTLDGNNEPDGPPELVGRSVILVDSQEHRREALADVLRAWRMNVVCSKSVASIPTTDPADLAIIDVSEDLRLDRASTIEALKPLAHKIASSLVILVPASDVVDDNEVLAELGVKAVGHQPATRTELKMVLPIAFGVEVSECEGVPASTQERKLSILVVEDKKLHRQAYRQTLETLGHDVSFAIDGPSAIAEINGKSFDLVLLDIRLKRGMNGLDVARHVRNLQLPDGGPKIIAVSGNPPRDDTEAAAWRASGIDEYIEKGAQVDLIDTIHRVMS